MYSRKDTVVTFFSFYEKLVLQVPLEHLMCCSCLDLEKMRDVIQVHKYTDIEHIQKHVVDQTFEDCRGIGESKRHDYTLVMTNKSIKGLPLIPLPDAYEVVSVSEGRA